MSLELAVKYVSFVMAIIAFSYAFHQRGGAFIIPEGVYIGSFTAYSLFQIYRSLKATALDFIAAGQVILVVPIIIGLLAYARLTRFRWLARYPVAILSGVGAGALFGLMVRGQLLAPIGDTVTAVSSVANDPVSRALFLVLLIPIISLFLYSRTFADIFHVKGQRLYYVQRIGRIAFMIIVAYQCVSPSRMAYIPTLFQKVIKPVIDDLVLLFVR